MEGAPSRDARPPPAGWGADFWRQFCAGGRTALLSDLSEPFPSRCSELASLDELAASCASDAALSAETDGQGSGLFAEGVSDISESFPSRCSETDAPISVIPQYLTTRDAPARAAGQAPTRIVRRLEATPPWPLGPLLGPWPLCSAWACIGNRGPSASRPRVGGGWRNLNRRTIAGSVAAASR